jgi:hypothetical protein
MGEIFKLLLQKNHPNRIFKKKQLEVTKTSEKNMQRIFLGGNMTKNLAASVGAPCHFGADPDPRIRTRGSEPLASGFGSGSGSDFILQ